MFWRKPFSLQNPETPIQPDRLSGDQVAGISHFSLSSILLHIFASSSPLSSSLCISCQSHTTTFQMSWLEQIGRYRSYWVKPVRQGFLWSNLGFDDKNTLMISMIFYLSQYRYFTHLSTRIIINAIIWVLLMENHWRFHVGLIKWRYAFNIWPRGIWVKGV